MLHRDIKPANLLFDEHGIVRVADFGLARALAEASWTEPAGAVLGTARYASPEQAIGMQLDARSDLYSLALVLVEVGHRPGAVRRRHDDRHAHRAHAALAAPRREALGPLAAGDRSRGRGSIPTSGIPTPARCGRRWPTPASRCRRRCR